MPTREEIIGRGWAWPIQIEPRGRWRMLGGLPKVEQAMAIILSTRRGARLRRPDFGCRIHDLVFAPANPETLRQAEWFVEEALALWEPRIEVLRVRTWVEYRPVVLGVRATQTGHGQLMVEVTYRVRATNDVRNRVFPFLIQEGGLLSLATPSPEAG